MRHGGACGMVGHAACRNMQHVKGMQHVGTCGMVGLRGVGRAAWACPQAEQLAVPHEVFREQPPPAVVHDLPARELERHVGAAHHQPRAAVVAAVGAV
eukprot:5415651-Pyramimonas_sp.AAC.2